MFIVNLNFSQWMPVIQTEGEVLQVVDGFVQASGASYVSDCCCIVGRKIAVERQFMRVISATNRVTSFGERALGVL